MGRRHSDLKTTSSSTIGRSDCTATRMTARISTTSISKVTSRSTTTSGACHGAPTFRSKDNIVFDNWAFGLHCYTNDGAYLNNIDLEGNVAFNNYIWGVPWGADILVGGLFPASGIRVNENYTYRT